MATLTELQTAADLVKNETQKRANTATRVGTLLRNIIDFFAEKKADTDLQNLRTDITEAGLKNISRAIGLYRRTAQPKQPDSANYPYNYNDKIMGWIRIKFNTKFNNSDWLNYYCHFGQQTFASAVSNYLSIANKYKNGYYYIDNQNVTSIKINDEGVYFLSLYINASIGTSSKQVTFYADELNASGNVVASHVEATHQFPSSGGKLQIISVPDKQISIAAGNYISVRYVIESATAFTLRGGHLSIKKIQ